MSKYLKIPSYYGDLKENIYSRVLQEALQEEDLLAYLRKAYQTNVSLFYNIRDELILRGIAFKNEYQNNFFPELPYKINNIIAVEDDQKKYLNIDHQTTGIQAIIHRYKVDSDMFFTNMPLEGISYFLRKDETFLAKQFKRAGFSISAVQTYNATEIGVKRTNGQQQIKEIHRTKEENNMLIRDYFEGRKFLAFHRYCDKYEMRFLSELTIDFIEEFRHVKGVGIAKYETVLKHFKEFEGTKREVPKKKVTAIEYFTCNPLKDILEKKEVDYSTFVDSIYYANEENDWYKPVAQQVFKEKSAYFQNLVVELKKDEDLKEFREMREKIRNHSSYELLMRMKIINIRKILKMNPSGEKDEDIHLFEMVENIKYKNDLSLIESSLTKFKPPHVHFETIKQMLTEREWQIAIERLDKTLQEVGDLIGLTRERVRQIETKALQKLKNRAKFLNLDIYFNYYLQNNLSMTIDEFMKELQIDLNNKDIFLLLIDSDGSFERKGDNLINKCLFNYAISIQDIIAKENKTIIDAALVTEKFNENSEFEFSLETIDYFMTELKYKRKNAIYFKTTIKLPAMIEYLFKYKIHEPFEMTDQNFDYLQVLMEEVFDKRFESGKRPAIERVRDTKNVILVNPNTFMYQNLDNVPEELLNDLEQTIEKELNNVSMITATTIYQNYLEVWQKYNLLSQYHLYSILHYHFDESYVIGKGNTLGIFKSTSAKVNTESIIIDYLEKNGGMQSKKQILHDLNWQSYKLEQVISKSKKIIPVEEERIEGYAVKLISAFNLKEEELQRIQQFMNDFINNDYFFTADLFLEMEFEDELSEILARANITNTYTFGSILKWLNPDLRGYQHLLYKKDSKIDSIEKVLIEEFPNLVRRDEIENFLEEKGYSQSSMFSIINLLLENKSFYIYTSYQYINSNQIRFNDEVKESLRHYLQKSFGDKLYCSALELTGYSTDILPITSNGWQPQLITEFSKYVGYIHIKTTSDYRYNKWILVREDLEVTNYEELVYYVVKNEYEGNFHERDLAGFLEARKLTHSPYQLSFELRTSKYFRMKDLEFVEIREG
ncbi:sigma factor-like helix-turn-helix DNA-binding protein [Priestia aryabhattai]|uniref:sigma factor-like helix-turn-helix DNA-binding protein n=1 Tax=Priestia aryabhattai TaxID=412384 RepID=UPI003100E738